MGGEGAAAGSVVFAHVDSAPEVPIAEMTKNPRDQGFSRRLIGKAVNGSPDLLVSVLRMEPNQYHPLHSHPNMGELYYVVEGACQIRVGDETRDCTRGTAIYTPAGVAHSVRTGVEGCAVMVAFPEGDWDAIEKVFVDDDHDGTHA